MEQTDGNLNDVVKATRNFSVRMVGCITSKYGRWIGTAGVQN
jgi:hypothetical protein